MEGQNRVKSFNFVTVSPCSALCGRRRPYRRAGRRRARPRVGDRAPAILVIRAPSLSSRAPWNLPVPSRSSPSSSVHAEIEESSPPLALPALARHPARTLRVLSCATSPRPSSTSPRPRPCPNPAEIELPPSPPSPFSLDSALSVEPSPPVLSAQNQAPGELHRDLLSLPDPFPGRIPSPRRRSAAAPPCPRRPTARTPWGYSTPALAPPPCAPPPLGLPDARPASLFRRLALPRPERRRRRRAAAPARLRRRELPL